MMRPSCLQSTLHTKYNRSLNNNNRNSFIQASNHTHRHFSSSAQKSILSTNRATILRPGVLYISPSSSVRTLPVHHNPHRFFTHPRARKRFRRHHGQNKNNATEFKQSFADSPTFTQTETKPSPEVAPEALAFQPLHNYLNVVFQVRKTPKQVKESARKTFEYLKHTFVAPTMEKQNMQTILVDLLQFHQAEATDSFRALLNRMDNPLLISTLIETEAMMGLDLSLSQRIYDIGIQRIRRHQPSFDRYAPYMYGAMMMSYAVRGEYDQVRTLMEEMSARSVRPSRDMLVALLFVYGSMNDMESLQQIENQIVNNEELLNHPGIAMATIFAHAVNGRFDHVKSFMDKLTLTSSQIMPAKLAVEAFTTSPLYLAAHLKNLENLIDNPARTIRVVTLIFKALNASGQYQLVIEIFKNMEQLKDNVHIVSEVMIAHTLDQNLGAAISLGHDMRRRCNHPLGETRFAMFQVALGRCFIKANKPIGAISQLRYAIEEGLFHEQDVIDLFNMEFSSAGQAIQAYNFFLAVRERYPISEIVWEAALAMLNRHNLVELHDSALSLMNTKEDISSSETENTTQS